MAIMIRSIALTALLAFAEPALAEALPPATTPAAKADDPLICRRERPTGTRFDRKICRRKSQIELRSVQDQDAMKERINAPQINPPSSG